MGFIDDLTKKASGIIGNGKKYLYTSNPILNQNPTQIKKPSPIFGVPSPSEVPFKTSTATANSTPKETNTTIKDIAAGVAEGGKQVANLGKEALQGTNRAVASVGVTAANVVLPGKPFKSEIDPSNNAFSKAILGETTVKDLPAYGQSGLDFIEETTGKKVSEKFALPLAGLGILSELSGTGKPVKNLIEQSVKAGTKKEAYKVLKDAGITDDVIKANNLDIKIADATDEVSVQNVLNEITAPPKKGAEFERSFSKRVREANPDANLTPQLDNRRNTAQLAARADEIVKNGDQQPYIDDIRSGNDVGEEHIAVASQLLNRYKQELDTATDMGRKNEIYESISDIAHDTAARLTEAGRTIQAASILGSVTPEGAIRRAARQINKYNTENPGKPIPKLSPEQTRIIYKEKEEINNMPLGEERAMREFFLNDAIARLTPSTKADMISNTWKAGLLTGLKTSGLNIASNTSHFITEILKDVPSVGVDIISALFTGQRTKALTARGIASGGKEGFGKGWRYFTTGFDERNVGGKLEFKPMNFGNSKTAKLFQKYTDTIFRTIGSQDQPFYYAAAKHSLWSQSLAAGMNKNLKGKELLEYARDLVNNPTEDILKRSVADAQMVVFQNKTELGRLAKGIQNAKIAGIPVGQFVVPFAQTPSAVAMQILNYSPVGAVKTIIQNIGKGKFDQKAFSDGLGRSIVGTAPLAIGAAMYQNGLISLEYPSGNEREIELDKAEGKTYNAFRTSEDDDFRSIITLGPAGNLLLFGAYFQKAMNESGSLAEAMYKGGLGALSSFTEQTFLTGFTNFTEFIDDPARYGDTYLPSLVASVVPTIVSDIAKANDPVQRNAKGEGFIDNVKTRTMNRVPGLRNDLPEMVDALGNVVPRSTGPISSMIDPTRPSQDISTPLTEELRRLTNEGYAVAPTKIGTSKGYASLTRQEEADFYKIVGSNVKEKLEILTSDELYQQLSDSERESIIKKISEQAKNQGAAIYVLQQTDGVPLEAQEDILKRLKEDGILNTDVFRAYKKLLEGDTI